MGDFEIALVYTMSCEGLTTSYVDLTLCRASTRDMSDSARYAAIVEEQRISAAARNLL